MLLFNKKRNTDEKRICALCEFSCEGENGFTCGRKKVMPTHSCRKFIYDPTKKKNARLSFDSSDFSFEPIE